MYKYYGYRHILHQNNGNLQIHYCKICCIPSVPFQINKRGMLKQILKRRGTPLSNQALHSNVIYYV